MKLDIDSLELQRSAKSARRRLKLTAFALITCIAMLVHLVAEAQAHPMPQNKQPVPALARGVGNEAVTQINQIFDVVP